MSIIIHFIFCCSHHDLISTTSCALLETSGSRGQKKEWTIMNVLVLWLCDNWQHYYKPCSISPLDYKWRRLNYRLETNFRSRVALDDVWGVKKKLINLFGVCAFYTSLVQSLVIFDFTILIWTSGKEPYAVCTPIGRYRFFTFTVWISRKLFDVQSIETW